MKKNCSFLIVFILPHLMAGAQANESPASAVPNQYIVVLKESAAKPVIKQKKKNNNREQQYKDNNPARENNLKKLGELKQKMNIKEDKVKYNYTDVIAGFVAGLSKEEKEALKKDPDVEAVYEDMQVQYLIPPIKTIPTPIYKGDCFLSTAGGSGDGSNNGKWIWILDTGIDLDHPDLKVNLPYARSFISGETPDDVNGHGTHVAGIAAAKNNSIGMTGVSAGAMLVPVKVCNQNGFYTTSSLIAGLNHVAQYDIGGDVVNLSLGSYGYTSCAPDTDPLVAAIKNLGNAGTFVCMAAGNNGGYAPFFFPGCINGTRIITVAALNCNLSCASYSNFGPNIDYYAVGTDVYSCYKNGQYTTMTGTSMATPVVSGIVHLRGWPATGIAITCNNVVKPVALR